MRTTIAARLTAAGLATLSLALAPLPVLAQVSSKGGGGGSGPGTEIVATTCPASSNSPSGGTVTLPNGYAVEVAYTASTTFTAGLTDCGQIVPLVNASPGTIVLPVSPTISAGYGLTLNNEGAGSWTVTPSGYTINGSSSPIVLASGQGVTLAFDGANYHVILGKATVTYGTNVATAVANNANATGGLPVIAGTPSVGACVSWASGGLDFYTCPVAGSAPTRISPLYYPMFPRGGNVVTGNAMATTTAYCTPFFLDYKQTWSDVYARMQTAGAGGATVAYAIYADGINATTSMHQPVGAPILSTTSTIAATANPIDWNFTSNSALAGNWQPSANVLYHFCGMISDASIRYYAPSSTIWPSNLMGSTTEVNITGSAPQTGVSINGQTLNTWPTWTTSTTFQAFTNIVMPNAGVKIVSVP